ncbi:MAG: hypothetical protein V2J24_21130 [Pseudomonadales bacterium]|jgi:hypothetical protein|nr:hypothetical protein [Pseudomonadales bacterium]
MPDCSLCRAPGLLPEERGHFHALYGCHGPIARPVFVTSCSACGGRDDDCERCEGSNEVPYHQCPGEVLRRDAAAAASVHEAVRAWQQYDARHLAPAPGGFLCQTGAFADLCEVLDYERGYHERRLARQNADA